VRPGEPDWPERDRFVLSKGHANAALGAVLAQAGFIDDAVLDRFYGLESPFGMHPDIKVPGVEMCTGALGHGLAVAMGMALGARIQKKAFHTFVMLGDGELHEGSNWEAAMAAAHYRLANLTAIVDHNKISQSGPVAEIVAIDPLGDKWRAFGWEVRELDGHDLGDVVDTLDALPLHPDRPTALIAHTVKGKGVSFAENTYLWHSNNVNDDIYARALGELGEP
jgi:transketolase